MDEIDALLNANPLPDDAEAQLDTLLATLPEFEREMVEAGCHEALAVAMEARGSKGYEEFEPEPLFPEA